MTLLSSVDLGAGLGSKGAAVCCCCYDLSWAPDGERCVVASSGGAIYTVAPGEDGKASVQEVCTAGIHTGTHTHTHSLSPSLSRTHAHTHTHTHTTTHTHTHTHTTLHTHTGIVYSVCWSSKHNIVASAGDDRTCRLLCSEECFLVVTTNVFSYVLVVGMCRRNPKRLLCRIECVLLLTMNV